MPYLFLNLSKIFYLCRMDVSYDIKNPKKYFLVTVNLADGKSVTAICHSWTPQGAMNTVFPSPQVQRKIGGREVTFVKVEPLDEYESIAKDDFCVQSSEDGSSWIITNISDSVVYKMPKTPREIDVDLAVLAYLNYEPVTDAELLNLYRRKLYIWLAKYGRQSLGGTLK